MGSVSDLCPGRSSFFFEIGSPETPPCIYVHLQHHQLYFSFPCSQLNFAQAPSNLQSGMFCFFALSFSYVGTKYEFYM